MLDIMNLDDSRLHKRLKLKSSIIEEVYSKIAEIDSIKKSWSITAHLLPQNIERLTQSVIITSTGSSNRIEGNLLSDNQVEKLYRNLRIKKLKTRDEQEVAGYLEMMERVFLTYNDIPISTSSILQFHRDMLKHSDKDQGHLGGYKIGTNRVEAKDASGKVIGVLFDPTPPYLVEKEMEELVDWYNLANTQKTKHPLLLISNFIFEYLAIHPFQDGNGRTSRLLTNLFLLKEGYAFTSLVSHEKIIENYKSEYYLALNKTQKTWKTEKEDISPWILFFLSVVKKQALNALDILKQDSIEHLLSEKQLSFWTWAQKLEDKEFSRKTAFAALGFPKRTIESIIKKFLDMNKIQKIGQGRATRYKIKI